jgi:VWFA-related protein
MPKFCVLAAVILIAQSATPQRSQSITSGTTAILVDVVVRDRANRLVTDLNAADFTVAEDSVTQKVDSFTRVTQGGGIGVNVAWRSPDRAVITPPPSAAAPAAPAGETPDLDSGTTAIVYGHLSAESLRLAQRATLDYIPMNGESSVRVGVFAADPNIRVLQPYTNDRSQVRRAVAQIAPSGTSAEEQKSNRSDELVARRRQLWAENQTATSGAVGGGAGLASTGAQIGLREAELKLVQMELDSIRSFEQTDREHRGYDVSMGLIAVINTLARYPGRKSFVFFSEGLPVSPALSARLDALIDAANRANVTAYAVDAAGLRAKSTASSIQKEVDVFAEERRVQNDTGFNTTSQPMTMSLERIEDTLKLDSHVGLARLAEDTGGFLIEGSNNLSSAFRRIDEDNQFHYLLTYSPKNTAMDGKFRTIQVKVARPGVQVFARKGYRALSALPRPADAAFDTPALALLDRASLPNAFPIYAAGFTFPDPARPGLTPVLVRVGTTTLRFDVDAPRSTYSAQAIVAVRVRDAQGGEVQRLSQQYLLTGDARDVDAAKHGEILFYREMDLSPGVYTLESIVYDTHSETGSARLATLTVPAPSSGFEVSSLLVVNKIEEIKDTSGASDLTAPLRVGGTLLYPNLGEPVRVVAGGELPFYFALYGDSAGVKVSAQLLRSGEVLAEAPVQLPDTAGPRVQHVGRLPIGALPAGTYELRIRVSDGRREVSRAAYFNLQR